MVKNLFFTLRRYIFVVPATLVCRLIKDRLVALLSRKSPIAPLPHPIDAHYGIETSGVISYRKIRSGSNSDIFNICYGGSQPSIIRTALSGISDIESYEFLDFGCGKGRALAVASEFSFKRIVGIELAPSLAAVARQNAKIIAERFPERTPIEVVEGDVLHAAMPAVSGIIVYFFHPFFRPMMKKVARKLEQWAEANPNLPLFVIYYNPVYYDLYDGSPMFSRMYARTIEFEPHEKGTGPHHNDHNDTVVIWQSVRAAQPVQAHPHACARISVDVAGLRAYLAP